MLTLDDWTMAGDFNNLVDGRKLPIEVSEEIYTDMLEVLPPQEFQNKTWENYKPREVVKQYSEYFLVGEATSHVKNRPVYSAFGILDGRYYYIGNLISLNPER